MADRRLLIAGGTGYFGARLAEVLRKDADLVLTHRSLSPERTAWLRRQDLRSIAFDSGRQQEFAVDGVFDAIVNLAMPGAGEAAADPDAALTRGVATAQACIALLSSGRAQRLIHFSTFHVYGQPGRATYDEADAPEPAHPYGRAHLAVEQTLLQSGAADRIAIVRPTNLAGAPAHADLKDQIRLIFLDLCRQARSGAIRLHNDGRSYRDVLPFEDAIEAVRMLTGAEAVPGGETYNLAAGQATRLDAIAGTVARAAPWPVEIVCGDGADPFRAPFRVSTTRLQAAGWQPRADLSAEAARCVAFFS